MSGEVRHLVNGMHRDEYDFHYAVCGCGYRSTSVPDIDVLIDEMMAHAQRLTPDDLLDLEAAARVAWRFDLSEYDYDYDTMPVVFQYNKRDLEDVASIAELNQALNPRNAPFFEAVALRGEGVAETFKAACSLVISRLNENLQAGAQR